MVRADDDSTDAVLAWAAMMFYFLACFFIVVTCVSGEIVLIWLDGAALLMGGIFHFIKVSSDGRVREAQRAQHVQLATRDGVNLDGGTC